MCSKCAKSLDVPSSTWKHQSLKLWALWSNKIKSRHLMVDVYWQFRTGAACMFSRTSHSMVFLACAWCLLWISDYFFFFFGKKERKKCKLLETSQTRTQSLFMSLRERERRLDSIEAAG